MVGEVDIRMIDGCFEEDGGRSIGVVWGESEVEFECEVGVGSVVWFFDGSGLWYEVFVWVGEGGDIGCWWGY